MRSSRPTACWDAPARWNTSLAILVLEQVEEMNSSYLGALLAGEQLDVVEQRRAVARRVSAPATIHASPSIRRSAHR